MTDGIPTANIIKTMQEKLTETKFECEVCGMPWIEGFTNCPECGGENHTDRVAREK